MPSLSPPFGAQLSRIQRKQLPSLGRRMSVKFASAGVGSSVATRTYAAFLEVEGHFDYVRIPVPNSSLVTGFGITGCIVAVTNTAADKITPSTGAWVPVTFDGLGAHTADPGIVAGSATS